MPQVEFLEEGRCPVCGSFDISENDKHKIWYEMGFDIPFNCGNCGFKGQYSFMVKLISILDENGFPVE